MPTSEPMGCLGGILRLLGIQLQSNSVAASKLPVRVRDDFLSKAELSFYRVLVNVLSEDVVVCPKVNLRDLFFVVRPNENASFRNRIDRKHVDFLLCDARTMQPCCGIELDDRSHNRTERQERDQLVNQVFDDAGLPLLRIPAQRTYAPAELRQMLIEYIDPMMQSQPLDAVRFVDESAPTCPRCGVPMVQRVARKGSQAGTPFFGCPNYPRCRQTTETS